MRYGILKDIDWTYMGALLANSDDGEQTKFFKSFVKEAKSWGTNYQVQLQLANVNHNLTEEERNILSMIGYDEDSDKRHSMPCNASE